LQERGYLKLLVAWAVLRVWWLFVKRLYVVPAFCGRIFLFFLSVLAIPFLSNLFLLARGVSSSETPRTFLNTLFCRMLVMATDATLTVTLAIVIGTLAAIVYSLRILVLLERRISRIDKHIELMALNILRDEKKELLEEEKIEKMLQSSMKRGSRKKSAKKKR
jgi:hypothetical protein